MSAPQAATAAPSSWTIQGREVRLPVVVRDASSAFATFIVDATAVRRIAPVAPLRLVEILPGRALCSIGVIEYRDNDLGQYNEIAVAFLVRSAATPVVPIVDFLRPGAGAYIHRLPVTTSFSRDAGYGIWGFPKIVADIRVRDEGRRRIGELHVDGVHVLTLAASNRGRFRFGEAPLDAYARRDGVLWKTPFTSTTEGVGFRLGGATLTLGEHPIAEELRSIGLPRRALASGWIGKMSARFGAPKAVAKLPPQA